MWFRSHYVVLANILTAMIILLTPAPGNAAVVTCETFEYEEDCNVQSRCLWSGNDPYQPSKPPCRHLSEWRSCGFWKEADRCIQNRTLLHDISGVIKSRESCVWMTQDYSEYVDGDVSEMKHGFCLEKAEICRLFDSLPSFCCMINRWGILRTLNASAGFSTVDKVSVVTIDLNSLILGTIQLSHISSTLTEVATLYGLDLGTLIHFPYIRFLSETDTEVTCSNREKKPCEGRCMQVSYANTQLRTLAESDSHVFNLSELLGDLEFTQEVCSTDLEDDSTSTQRLLIMDVDMDNVEDWGCQYLFSGGKCVVADGGICAHLLNPGLLCTNRYKKSHCEFPSQPGQICTWDEFEGCWPINREWDENSYSLTTPSKRRDLNDMNSAGLQAIKSLPSQLESVPSLDPRASAYLTALSRNSDATRTSRRGAGSRKGVFGSSGRGSGGRESYTKLDDL